LQLSDPIAEGARIFSICNACRYCEGYCAVFPAMERRREFREADLDYLANLCHHCAECYYACQYAPPHEFAVNVPKVLAQVRLRGYEKHAWPPVFRSGGRIALAALLLGLVAGLMLARNGSAGDFYAVIPHGVMVAVFAAVSILAIAAMAIGLIRSLTVAAPKHVTEPRPSGSGLVTAIRDVLTLKYLSSGGAGCTYPNEEHSSARRWFHHCTFYGFLLCFASTSVAAVYHYGLNERAPYPYFSLPVVLGMLGGIGLLIGPAGLYRLKRRRDAAIADSLQDRMEITFLALLFATSLSGLLLLVFRSSLALRPLLVIHLAIVLALFVTLPYGKFVHGFYRAAALVRFAVEEHGGREAHGAGEG
jgi:citrate/tricarballylate utilization protein